MATNTQLPLQLAEIVARLDREGIQTWISAYPNKLIKKFGILRDTLEKPMNLLKAIHEWMLENETIDEMTARLKQEHCPSEFYRKVDDLGSVMIEFWKDGIESLPKPVGECTKEDVHMKIRHLEAKLLPKQMVCKVTDLLSNGG